MGKYVQDFTQGNKDQKDLLGGKGANLAEMTNIGLPVPPGFTITTEACRAYMETGENPAELDAEVTEELIKLEEALGKKLGDPANPLLVSVRSGAKFSMPGMMETVLNIGLNDESVKGLAQAASGDERFAWDSYRRLIQMFGKTVLDIDGEKFSHALDSLKQAKGVTADTDLTAADLQELVETYKQIVKDETGEDFPQDPRAQLDKAIVAVFNSWNTDRAQLYRRRERIPNDLGTAVNVCSMVFGNLNDNSGTGVAFTRDPASGKSGHYGDYLVNAQGEDVVAGIRNTLSLDDMERVDKAAHDELMGVMDTLEGHYRDLCDIEFTVENGKLWMLQTRIGKRTAGAAFRVAGQLVDEGKIDLDEALERVTGAQLTLLTFPQFKAGATKNLLTTAMAASPGAAVGAAVFDSPTAEAWAKEGKKVILVRRETNPDDLGGMIASEGVLTSRGGKTSHAAVVARGMGTTCVVGADELDVDAKARQFTVGDTVVSEGDVISIDGTTGEVFLGAVEVQPSPVVRYLDAGLETALAEVGDDTDQADLVKAVDRILTHADSVRKLGVEANADTPADAAQARRFGAEGIGLCRTEHMFLGPRRVLIERVILAEDDAAKQSAYDELMPLQKDDFIGILTEMDGLPVTIRLIDPPLHEFLPDMTDLSVKVAVAKERGEDVAADEKLLGAVRKMHEANPMLGLRGVRLGIVLPGLFGLQIRAIAEAQAECKKRGQDPKAEIMVPLIGSIRELDVIREMAEGILAEVEAEAGISLGIPIGCMIELPRAALTAGQIAESADFFSFGTNDLTQTTWGFSRDDVEGAFVPDYIASGILAVSPFETLDSSGVGRLVKLAVEEGKKTNPDLHLGVCGEHGGDPESIHFFATAGLDYVSCSPYRVPIARLEAGRAAVESGGSDSR